MSAEQGNDRIAVRFEALKKKGRGGLVTFVTAGDPTPEISAKILGGLAGAGADLIELGMPFSDPMADGPVIEAASVRALNAGMSLNGVLAMVANFRTGDDVTPVILMGYFNPIHAYGIDAFVSDASAAGVDGLIIVDLPPEEEAELAAPARQHGIHVVRLIAPTSDDTRLPRLLEGAGGLIYYVAVAGITGAKGAAAGDIGQAMTRLRQRTDLPIAVGFGIKTPAEAAAVAGTADAAVVGTSIVQKIEDNLDAEGTPGAGLADKVLDFVRELADSVRATAGG